jgi:hypothetical protein
VASHPTSYSKSAPEVDGAQHNAQEVSSTAIIEAQKQQVKDRLVKVDNALSFYARSLSGSGLSAMDADFAKPAKARHFSVETPESSRPDPACGSARVVAFKAVVRGNALGAQIESPSGMVRISGSAQRLPMRITMLMDAMSSIAGCSSMAHRVSYRLLHTYSIRRGVWIKVLR